MFKCSKIGVLEQMNEGQRALQPFFVEDLGWKDDGGTKALVLSLKNGEDVLYIRLHGSTIEEYEYRGIKKGHLVIVEIEKSSRAKSNFRINGVDAIIMENSDDFDDSNKTEEKPCIGLGRVIDINDKQYVQIPEAFHIDSHGVYLFKPGKVVGFVPMEPEICELLGLSN